MGRLGLSFLHPQQYIPSPSPLNPFSSLTVLQTCHEFPTSEPLHILFPLPGVSFFAFDLHNMRSGAARTPTLLCLPVHPSSGKNPLPL